MTADEVGSRNGSAGLGNANIASPTTSQSIELSRKSIRFGAVFFYGWEKRVKKKKNLLI